jgi:hypothetical protein
MHSMLTNSAYRFLPARWGRFFAAACLIAAFACAHSARADLVPEEHQFLADLYRATGGDQWAEHDGWGEDEDDCTHYRVICDGSGEHVESLVLDHNKMSGELPANLHVLSHLRMLSLRGNDLHGRIPSLAGMTQLEYLELSDNAFDGTLPSFDDLNAMQSLHIDGTHVEGRIPALSGMPHLQFFEMSRNRLEGPLPELIQLRELKELMANGNRLEGPLPAIAGMPLLHDFYVGDNRIDGEMPKLHDLPELRYFIAYGNALSGKIPDLSGAPNLQELSVANNRLSGPLPAPAPRMAQATLCPNALDHPSADAAIDAAWNRLTKTQPWWGACP